MSPAVTLERYAEIRAEMEAGALRDDALARAGMTTDEWTVAQREWLEKMGTELDRGRFELSNRYSQAFLERQRALTRVQAPRLAPELAAHLGASVPIVARSALEGSSQQAAVAVPSYLQGPQASHQGGLPAAANLRTTGAFVAPLGPSLPFAKAPPGGAPIASQPPPEAPKPKVAPKSQLGGTSFAIDNSAMRAALPFAGGPAKTPPEAQSASAAPAPPPAAVSKPKVAPKSELGGTSFAIDNSAMRAALPFGGAAPAPTEPRPPGASPVAPPLPPAKPPPPKAAPKLGGTSFAIDNSAMRAALPFAGAAGAAPHSPPAVPASPSQKPLEASSVLLQRPAPPPLPGKTRGPAPGGETSMALDIPREALPFPTAAGGENAKPAAPRVTLTLEQYASVCAEMAVAPGTEDAIRKKYGILDEGAWKALDNQWQAKFLFDAAARKKWLDLTEQYRRWLLAQAR